MILIQCGVIMENFMQVLIIKDLGSIVCMVTKENTEMQKWYLDNIKESLKEINTK